MEGLINGTHTHVIMNDLNFSLQAETKSLLCISDAMHVQELTWHCHDEFEFD